MIFTQTPEVIPDSNLDIVQLAPDVVVITSSVRTTQLVGSHLPTIQTTTTQTNSVFIQLEATLAFLSGEDHRTTIRGPLGKNYI